MDFFAVNFLLVVGNFFGGEEINKFGFIHNFVFIFNVTATMVDNSQPYFDYGQP